MFEKEAEDNKPSYAFCGFNTKCELWKDGFQQGAKFGYNKAKVEVEDSYRESICNSELNLASITEKLEKRIAELEKENAELKSKNCWETCEYAEPKSQWISQHIKDLAQLSKAKELIKKLVHEFYYLCELYNFATDYECLAEADQFIREVRSE